MFVSGRPDPDVKDSDDDKAALWRLPAGGGEARVIATRPGGVSGVVVARRRHRRGRVGDAPGGDTRDEDEHRRKERKDRKISAILHETYPVRYWDHDLGPDAPRLFAGTLAAGRRRRGRRHGVRAVTLRDITPDAGRALAAATVYDITPDGSRSSAPGPCRSRAAAALP